VQNLWVYPYLVHATGTDMGTAKNTHGLPVQSTTLTCADH
jgi:hypothetical protein